MWFKKEKKMSNLTNEKMLETLWNDKYYNCSLINKLEERVRILEYRLDFPPKYKIGDVIEEGTVTGMKIAMPVYDKEGNRLHADWSFEVLTKEGRKIEVLK